MLCAKENPVSEVKNGYGIWNLKAVFADFDDLLKRGIQM